MSAEEKELDVGYLDEVNGQGFENMGTSETAVPRLLIAQSNSEVVTNEKVKAGHFYNSITGEDYGDTIDLIVCHFQKVWVEWKKNMGGYVGTYPVGGLEGVTGDPFKGMEHTDAEGNVNDVIETWDYLVILPDHRDAGYLIFGSTRGNLKYLKGWNTQMRYLRTPSGKPAPLFSSIWTLATGKDTNKQGKTFFSCNKDGKPAFTWKDWTTKELFLEYVTPARQAADTAVLLADNRTQAIEADAGVDDTGSSEDGRF